MAGLPDSLKLDTVFKSRVGRETTTTDKAWYEEFPAKTVYLGPSEVYAEEIPSTPPSSSTSSIQVLTQFELTEDASVSNHRAWKAYATPGDTSSERLTHFIHPRYGQGYTVRVYDNNGNEIPTTDPSKWFFDYETGILIFDEDPTTHGWVLPIKISAYRYTGQFISDVLSGSSGGYRDSAIAVISIPQGLDLSQESIINGIILGKIGSTHLADNATFYSTHYGRFPWKVVTVSDYENSPESQVSTYDELKQFIRDNYDSSNGVTVILRHRETSSYPTIDYIHGYNMLFSVMKGRRNYYKRFPRAIDTTQIQWEGLSTFISKVYTLYFGSTPSITDDDLAKTFWFGGTYRNIYSHPKIGAIVVSGNTSVSTNIRKAYNPDSATVTDVGDSNLAFVVIDRLTAFRSGSASTNVYVYANTGSLSSRLEVVESAVSVYVLYNKENNLYAFLIKPIGQDHFVIPYDVYAKAMGLKLYAIYQDSRSITRRYYRNMSDTLGPKDSGENLSAQAAYILTVSGLFGYSGYPMMFRKGRHVRFPQWYVRFAWVDDNGVSGYISRAYIGGRDSFVPMYFVVNDK